MTLHNEQDAIKQAVGAGWLYQDDTFIKNPVSAVIECDRLVLKGRPTSDGWDGGTSSIKLSELNTHKILQDPAFWQALGKARGWGQEISISEAGEAWGKRTCMHCGIDTAYQPPKESGCNHVHYPEACKFCSDKATDWKEVAHRWFETLMSKGDMQAFWESLP